jgi:large subunit ribosomal protein L32
LNIGYYDLKEFMSQEPKRRHSVGRKGKRRAALKLVVKKTIPCPNCQATILNHLACKKCGYYKGQSAVTIKTKDKKKE